MQKTIKIVKNNKQFFEDLYKIHMSCFSDEEKMTKECFFDEFNQKTRVYFVALCDKKPIGYVGVFNTTQDYNIIGLAVLPEFRKQGIATNLLRKLIDSANKKKIKALSLEVNENNKNAISFYKKNGFVLTNIRKNYYKNNDAFIMWHYL